MLVKDNLETNVLGDELLLDGSLLTLDGEELLAEGKVGGLILGNFSL